ncbi:MAG: hypothetical protein DMF95_04255, partial [Acidobacteria bacterium]
IARRSIPEANQDTRRVKGGHSDAHRGDHRVSLGEVGQRLSLERPWRQPGAGSQYERNNRGADERHTHQAFVHVTGDARDPAGDEQY